MVVAAHARIGVPSFTGIEKGVVDRSVVSSWRTARSGEIRTDPHETAGCFLRSLGRATDRGALERRLGEHELDLHCV